MVNSVRVSWNRFIPIGKIIRERVLFLRAFLFSQWEVKVSESEASSASCSLSFAPNTKLLPSQAGRLVKTLEKDECCWKENRISEMMKGGPEANENTAFLRKFHVHVIVYEGAEIEFTHKGKDRIRQDSIAFSLSSRTLYFSLSLLFSPTTTATTSTTFLLSQSSCYNAIASLHGVRRGKSSCLCMELNVMCPSFFLLTFPLHEHIFPFYWLREPSEKILRILPLSV